jgi:uncharacterized membrane protein (DUF2068 family)
MVISCTFDARDGTLGVRPFRRPTARMPAKFRGKDDASSVRKKGSTRRGSRASGLLLIAAFKLFKGAALLAVAFGARHLLNHDLAANVEHWVDLLRIDPHNRYILMILEEIANLDEHRLRELRAGTLFYATLFLVEGTGLALRQRWAEYVTIISTSSLIPLEVYELVKQYSPLKIAFLLINIAVVVYLIFELRRNRHK